MNGSGLALISILVIALLAVAVGTTQLQAQKDADLKAMTEMRNTAVVLASANNDVRETAVAERDSVQKQADALTAQVSTLNSEKADLQTQFNSLQSQFTTLQSEKDSLQSQYTALQSEKSALQSQYSSLQSEKENLQSKFTALQSEKDSLQSQYTTLQSQNAYLKAANDVQAAKYAELQKQTSEPKNVVYFPRLFGNSKEPLPTTGGINNEEQALCVVVPTGEAAVPWVLSIALGMGVVMMVGGVGYALYSQDPNRKYTLRLTRDQMKEFARYQRERGKRAA